MPFSFIRQHKILSVLAALFSLLVLGMVAIVLFAAPVIKSLTENKGGAKLGREFSIEGPFTIDWSWRHTKIHAEKIRLGNAAGYKEPDMLALDGLDVTFNPSKLLLGRLEIGDIKLTKPFVVLEKKENGEANWDFPALSSANAAKNTALADNRHNFPIIGNLEMTGGRLVYRDDVRGLDLDLTLDTVSGQGGSGKKDASGFKISGAGNLQKQKFSIDATGGSLNMLRDTSTPFPLDLKLNMGPTEIIVKGTFDDPVKLTGVDADLKITGHNLADIFYLTAIPLPPTPPYSIDGRLTKKEDVWAYSGFSGKVGGSDLSGDLSYDTGGARGVLKANLVSNLLDGRDLGGFIGVSPSSENAAPEQKQEAAKKKASPRLIPNVPIQLERLRSADMDVTLNAKKIDAKGIPFKGMNVRFDLKNGLLKLDPLNIVLADGTVDGTVEIDGRQDVPPMKMNLNLRRLSLKQFFGSTRFASTTRGFFGGHIDLSGQGKSLAQVLATSNGRLTIIMAGGKMSLLLVEASDLDIGQALPLFVGEDKSTDLRCGVADFDVKNGLLTSKAFVLDTADSLILADATIDMKNETINARLKSKPKDDSLFSLHTPITVNGHLKKPSIGVDKTDAGLRSGAAAVLGTLLTPFAAIIPFIEVGEEQNADCRRLIGNAQK